VTNIGDILWPGQIVPVSGTYRVIHDPRHAEDSEVICVKGQRFPICQACTKQRFVLGSTAHMEIPKLIRAR
jgi:hypothetical protein